MIDNGNGMNLVPSPGQPSVAPWENRPPSVPAVARPSFERPLAAIRRYKWLIVGVLLLAIPAGLLATHMVTPVRGASDDLD